MNVVLSLLHVTRMPTVPTLAGRITAPARQDTLAMAKLAKVGENSYQSNLRVSQFTAEILELLLQIIMRDTKKCSDEFYRRLLKKSN